VKEYTTDALRNIVLVGHGGAGKTIFAEAMLFSAGVTNRLGRIEDGTTVSDYNADEIQRKISIGASILHCEWNDSKVNIIDTPGYTDFTGEVKCGVRVADTAIVFLKGMEGIEGGTELVWHYAQDDSLPVVLAVNKLDAEHADFDKVVGMARERFGNDVIVTQFPMNQGVNFNSIVDVVRMKLLTFSSDGGGKYSEDEIPANLKAKADELHEQLVEKIAETDETLLNAFFDQGGLSPEEIQNGLRGGITSRKLFPILCAAAARNVGITSFLDFLVAYCPSPIRHGAITGTKVGRTETVTLKPEASAEPTLFVFKTVSERNVGELSFFRVYSGAVSSGLDLINEATGKTERLSQVFVMNGKERKETARLLAGDIGAVVKLKDTHTNNTLSSKAMPVILPVIQFPAPVISAAILPKSKGDEDRISTGLHRLHEEDPTFVVTVDHEINQTIISGQGELHLHIVVKRLKERYGVEVDVKEPKIPYRERIRSTARVSYRHKKQTGGAGQFGEVYFHMEPYREGAPMPSDLTIRGSEAEDLPWGGKLEFVSAIVGGAIDAKFIPAVKKGVMEIMHAGPLAGYPVTDVRVILYDGKMHPVDSNENAFKTAGRMAFRDGFLQAKPMLLEPIYEITVMVPEEYMGDVMGDLNQRRGRISGMDTEGSFQTIKALVPLAEIHQYATRLRSMTQGRGMFRRKFSHYDEVPREIAEKIVAASKKEVVEEEA
jgi:elongation factor G